MRHARSSPPTAVALALAVGLSGLAAVGCYRPNIKDGGFKCNLDAGAAHFCPDGYTCDLVLDQCWKGPHGDGGPGGMAGTDARDTGGADVPDVGVACVDAMMPNCTQSDAGVCDPFCQTGCGCREKCSVSADGGILCLGVSTSPGSELSNCNTTFKNGQAIDDCAPGLVCMQDNCPSSRCYRFCRVDADCPNSFCSRTAPGGLKVCDVPIVDSCNPVAPTSGCPGAQACYVSFGHPEHTICDCPGGTPPNMACSGSRSCYPGLVCADPMNGQGLKCLAACDLDGGVGCAGGPCQPYTGSDASNTPNPKFGYCF